MMSECALRIRCEFASSEKKSATNSIRIHSTPHTNSNIQWKCRDRHWTPFSRLDSPSGPKPPHC